MTTEPTELDERLAPLDGADASRYLVPTEWLIEDYLELGTAGVLFGPPDSGKTTLALDWAMSVATGKPWHGHQAQPGNVAYMVQRRPQIFMRAIAAWSAHHDTQLESGALTVIPAASSDDGVMPLLVRSEIDLLVIDMPGLIDLAEVPAIVADVFALRDVRGPGMTTVLLVYRPSSNRADNPALAALVANLDFAFSVRCPKDTDGWVLHCAGMKALPHPDDWGFTLRQVEVDTGINGMVIQEDRTGLSVNVPVLERTRKQRKIHKSDQSERLQKAYDELGSDATEQQTILG
jgi:hypothetical protein